MLVRDAMVWDAKTCGPDDTLEAAAMIMWNSDCGSVPIVDHERRPLGVVTDRDIAMACALNHKSLWEIKANEVLDGKAVFTCHGDDDIKAALKTMWGQKVRRLPVVDHAGHLAGILSVDDVIARAERGTRGQLIPDISYDDAMTTLKAVATHH